MHDASAAAFDDYTLLAAAAEERFTRQKGEGRAVPWLAVDEVLRISGWSRRDVDAIATTRGFFSTRYYAFPRWREVYYALRGREHDTRELAVLSNRFGVQDPHKLFRADRFLKENSFRPDTQVHFANHHEAHALAALFYTDWDDALIYTADGIGDNVSYSMRALKGDRLECHYGDDSYLTRRLNDCSIATAYGLATLACGFRMWRHEGKLTGLSAYGEPKLAGELGGCFRFDNRSGLIESDFRHWTEMREKILGICQGHDRATIAASVQQVAEELILQSVRFWLARAGARHLALAGGLFANVRLNRLLAESLPLEEVFIFPAMGDDGLSVGAALALLHARDGTPTWLPPPPPARQRVSRAQLRRRDRRYPRCRRDAAVRRPAGRERGRSHSRRQGRRNLYRPDGIWPARARLPLDHREPARPRDQRQSEQAT